MKSQVVALRGVIRDAVEDGILSREFAEQVIELVTNEFGGEPTQADKPPDGPGGGG